MQLSARVLMGRQSSSLPSPLLRTVRARPVHRRPSVQLRLLALGLTTSFAFAVASADAQSGHLPSLPIEARGGRTLVTNRLPLDAVVLLAEHDAKGLLKRYEIVRVPAGNSVT